MVMTDTTNKNLSYLAMDDEYVNPVLARSARIVAHKAPRVHTSTIATAMRTSTCPPVLPSTTSDTAIRRSWKRSRSSAKS